MKANQTTEILGDEYDEKLWESLKRVIKQLNGEISEEEWTLVGSQEIDSYEVDIEGSTILIESETYIGLSISGDSQIVKTIKKMI